MKVAVLLASSLALLVADSTPTPEKLRFTPTEGLVLTRTFKAVKGFVNRNPAEQDVITFTTSSTESLVVTDIVLAVEGGRITKLTRTFDEVSSEGEIRFESGPDPGILETSMQFPVEGSTVVFEWDKTDEAYSVASDDVDEDLIAELVFAYDFLALLPDDDVAVGDEWTVDVEAFRVLTNPWVRMPWVLEAPNGEPTGDEPNDDANRDGAEQEVFQKREGEWEGEILVTFAGTRVADDVTVGVIALEGELRIERIADKASEADGVSSTEHSVSTETRAIGGEGLWNLEAGRLQSLEIGIEETGTSASVTAISDQKQGAEFEYSAESTGTTTFSVSIVVVE